VFAVMPTQPFGESKGVRVSNGVLFSWITLAATLWASLPFSYAADICTVNITWQSCGPYGCSIMRDTGTGSVIGHTKAGNTLVLGCAHNFRNQGSLKCGGHAAKLLAIDNEADLSLIEVTGKFGTPFLLASDNPPIGTSVGIHGMGQGYNSHWGETVSDSQVNFTVRQGDSGGPVEIATQDDEKVLCGVVVSIDANPPQYANFVCIRRIKAFLKGRCPEGCIRWQGQKPQAVVPPPPPAPPPRDIAPSRPDDSEIRQLRERVAALETALKDLERRRPPTQPGNGVPGPAGPAGTVGRDGRNGQDGLVTVEILYNGKTVGTLKNLKPGTTVRQPIDKIIKDPDDKK
jgi:hypothetical protein